jgi:hypothetical protein
MERSRKQWLGSLRLQQTWLEQMQIRKQQQFVGLEPVHWRPIVRTNHYGGTKPKSVAFVFPSFLHNHRYFAEDSNSMVLDMAS